MSTTPRSSRSRANPIASRPRPHRATLPPAPRRQVMTKPPDTTTLPAHLRPLTVDIPRTWTPEEALAVFKLIDDLRDKVWALYSDQLQADSCVSNAHTITPTTVTTPSTRTRSEPSKRRPPPEARQAQRSNPNSHPVVRSRQPSRRQRFSMRLSRSRGDGGESGMQHSAVNRLAAAKADCWPSAGMGIPGAASTCRSVCCSDHCEDAWTSSRTSAAA